MKGNYEIGAISIIGMILALGYLIIFGQKKQFQKSFITPPQHLIRIYNMTNKWYTIKVTPVEADGYAQTFKIETSNLKQTMEKYTRDKEGNIKATWEVLKQQFYYGK